MLTFANPTGTLPALRKLLAYFNPDDPAFLHLTDGKGAIIGTWLLRGRVANGDAEMLAQAHAYQARAMKAARDRADELNAPERKRLDAMRAYNTELLRLNEFTDVAEVGPRGEEIKTSPVASGLNAVKKQKAATKQAAKDELEVEREAHAALMEGMK